MYYYKKNIGDYYKKTGRLSMLEHGAYTLLIDACYDREVFPTYEDALDWTWARSEAEEQAVKFVLTKFFTLKDGVYIQTRIQEEVEKLQKACFIVFKVWIVGYMMIQSHLSTLMLLIPINISESSYRQIIMKN